MSTTLACDFKNAWIIAETYHEEAQRAGGTGTSYDFAKSESRWLATVDDVKTRILLLNEEIIIPELSFCS